MKERGYTIADLAERSDLSEDTIKRVLYRECDPRLSTICMLADALDCTIDDLIGRRTDVCRPQELEIFAQTMIDMMKDYLNRDKNVNAHRRATAEGHRKNKGHC